MNITFLIGNGFDLNLGLRTSYKSFLEYYLQTSKNDTSAISQFKEHINHDFETWGDAELALGACTKHYSGKAAIDEFYECYDNMYDALAAYLAAEERRLDTCKSGMLSAGMLHALTQWQNGFRTLRKQTIETAIANCPGGFTYNFIVFNYTRTFDRCLQALPNPQNMGVRILNGSRSTNSIGRTIHAHGYTDKDMIFAVNDESQIANSEVLIDRLIFDTNRLIKVEANRLFEENTDEDAHKLLNQSDLIYIYGMSLGETDILWWQRIGELMKKKKNLHVIIYAYDAPNDQLHYPRFLHYENRIHIKLILYNDGKQDIDINRIHVTGHNIFSKLAGIVPSEPKTSDEKLQLND